MQVMHPFKLFLLLFFMLSMPSTATLHDAFPQPTPPTAMDTSRTNHHHHSHATCAQIVAFAKSLIGKPYHFGCEAPATGFDCSGFIHYVFTHFNIDVPRSSVSFTNMGTEVPEASTQPGDVILFTGTDHNIRTVGHIGIVVSNVNGDVSFVHATSGKASAVTISRLQETYKSRFVKIIRLLQGP